jgi:PAS domain S-box-containing protein
VRARHEKVAELSSVAPLNKTLRLLAIERKILADVVGGRALQAALTELVEAVRALVGRKVCCTLFLYERETGRLGHALPMDLPPPLIALETDDDHIAVSPARLALVRGESVFLEDVEAWGKLGAPPPLRAAWSTPVLSIDGRKLGALVLYFQRRVRPTMRDRELLLIAANSVTLAIKRSNSDMILQDREAELARVQKIGGIGGVEVDLRAGFHNRRSPEYLAIHGLPPDAAHESHEDWVRRIHPDDRARAERTFLDAIASGTEDYASEYRIIRPSDGETRWISVKARIERDAEGHALRLVGAHIDITDRMLAEKKLRESEERFRLIANSAPVPIWVSKLNGQRAFANQAYLDFLGMGYEEALVFDWRKILHPDDLPRILKEQIAGESSLKPFVLEARYLRADGKWRWIRSESQPRWDADGRHAGFIGVAHDITASKGAEDDLRRLNENLAIEVATRTRERDRIWNVSQDLLLVVDRRGSWLSVNPAWREATGWTPDQLLGPTNVEHEHLPVLQKARKSLTRLASDSDAARFESSFPVQGGGERWIAWTSVRDEDLIYAVGRDVTAEKDAQRALRATEEQLRQAHKMEAVGQLTGGIAHDFNNLLTSIIGGLELTKRRIATKRFDEVDRFIEPVMNSAHRAAALTHRLLAFSRRQSLDVKAIDVSKLIESMEDLLSRTLGNQIALVIAADPDIWVTETDQNQLENAVLNLVINARDAMPEGGQLMVEARNLTIESDGDIPAGDYVTIAVRDQGVGMTPAQVERAFDPFFTTKPIGQGTGLGLSMVYGFTKQSRGHVRIDSEPAKGTVVTLFLPRSARSLSEPKDAAASRLANARAGGTILVVEDEPAVRLVVSESLAELGYRTIEAHDGASALALMDQRSKIDLLITDVGLPGMNGRQLAELAQVKRPALKVLFMTGYAEKVAAGADFWSETTDLITKPFEAQAFAAKVREIIER